MDNDKVVATLWMLVAVALVCLFAGLVSKAADDREWSHVETPTTTTVTYWRR